MFLCCNTCDIVRTLICKPLNTHDKLTHILQNGQLAATLNVYTILMQALMNYLNTDFVKKIDFIRNTNVNKSLINYQSKGMIDSPEVTKVVF